MEFQETISIQKAYTLHTASSLNPPEYLYQHAVRLLLQRTQVRHDLLHGAQLHGLVEVLGKAQLIAAFVALGSMYAPGA